MTRSELASLQLDANPSTQRELMLVKLRDRYKWVMADFRVRGWGLNLLSQLFLLVTSKKNARTSGAGLAGKKRARGAEADGAVVLDPVAAQAVAGYVQKNRWNNKMSRQTLERWLKSSEAVDENSPRMRDLIGILDRFTALLDEPYGRDKTLRQHLTPVVGGDSAAAAKLIVIKAVIAANLYDHADLSVLSIKYGEHVLSRLRASLAARQRFFFLQGQRWITTNQFPAKGQRTGVIREHSEQFTELVTKRFFLSKKRDQSSICLSPTDVLLAGTAAYKPTDILVVKSSADAKQKAVFAFKAPARDEINVLREALRLIAHDKPNAIEIEIYEKLKADLYASTVAEFYDDSDDGEEDDEELEEGQIAEDI
jgi:hypothetical protein